MYLIITKLKKNSIAITLLLVLLCSCSHSRKLFQPQTFFNCKFDLIITDSNEYQKTNDINARCSMSFNEDSMLISVTARLFNVASVLISKDSILIVNKFHKEYYHFPSHSYNNIFILENIKNLFLGKSLDGDESYTISYTNRKQFGGISLPTSIIITDNSVTTVCKINIYDINFDKRGILSLKIPYNYKKVDIENLLNPFVKIQRD